MNLVGYVGDILWIFLFELSCLVLVGCAVSTLFWIRLMSFGGVFDFVCFVGGFVYDLFGYFDGLDCVGVYLCVLCCFDDFACGLMDCDFCYYGGMRLFTFDLVCF